MQPSSPSPSRIPHRIAWALVLATFPLIWVGGLVTTFAVGMAVPDWPTTYHHWFWYDKWFTVWGVFLEHSHRVLGMLTGNLTIALLVALCYCDARRWMRGLGVVALLGVCLQGLLGGLRVLANEVVLADVHGCTAPLFFAFTVALAAFTSPAWQADLRQNSTPLGRRIARAAACFAGLVYLQIVFGVQVRHLPHWIGVTWFPAWFWVHVINAAILAVSLAWLVRQCLRLAPAEPRIRRRALRLAGLLAIQILLGLGTWIVKYGWPNWAQQYVWPLGYTVQSGGWVRGTTITAHVAVGSLCLATALSLALWSHRVTGGRPEK